MPTKQCPACHANGMNMMNAEVVQLANVDTNTPEKINWTCGYCGFKDSDTFYISEFGTENTKTMINPPVEEAPIEAAARPTGPLKTAKKPPKPVEKPVEEPVAPPADKE
jgi:hypothetical protein